MEIELLEYNKNEIKLKIVGEGHTLLNALKTAIFEDKDVINAGYTKEHPMVERAILYLKTNGNKDPFTVLESSIERLIRNANLFKNKFEAALMKFK